MIYKSSKQDWSIGSWVKVGFLKLKVLEVKAVYDGMPDIYTLESSTGKKYEFIPHNGLFKI
jgi:hypothetical protein